jgi:hypothetical protein
VEITAAIMLTLPYHPSFKILPYRYIHAHKHKTQANEAKARTEYLPSFPPLPTTKNNNNSKYYERSEDEPRHGCHEGALCADFRDGRYVA